MTLSKDFDPKRFGTVFNDDTFNMWFGNAVGGCTPEHYKDVVLTLLRCGKPGVYASDGGQPDPVRYRSEVATCFSKYYEEICEAVGPGGPGYAEPQMARATREMADGFAAADTDMLNLAAEACNEAGVPIVVSYRMNGEDWGHMELEMSDFGRTHRHLAIPGTHLLDPAHVEVYMHRLDIFREVVEKYDIDGIELNWGRWYNMVSNPLHNHPVLTRMVSDVRRILDEAATKKGRGRLILGARVGAFLEGPFRMEDFPGANFPSPTNQSCRDLGLDVKSWIDSGHVDYICPSLFIPILPGLPRTAEFVALAKGTGVGVYPTLCWCPPWLNKHGEERLGIPTEPPLDPDDTERLLRYKGELCDGALKMYEDGADGISTFNWWPHHQPGVVTNPNYIGAKIGLGGKKVLMKMLSVMGDRAALEDYANTPAPF